MGSMSVWHWLIVWVIVTVFPFWNILRKAGFSGWWSFLSLVPLLNLVLLWVFAFTPWPSTKGRHDQA